MRDPIEDADTRPSEIGLLTLRLHALETLVDELSTTLRHVGERPRPASGLDACPRCGGTMKVVKVFVERGDLRRQQRGCRACGHADMLQTRPVR